MKQIQGSVFADEITNVRAKGTRLPLVRQLRLFLDSNGLLRCGGRIHNALISELVKFLYLLPSHHNYTTLVIKNARVSLLHAGVNTTLMALRQQYWIPSARQRIKSFIRKCVICKKTSGKPYNMPDPPPLVKSRVSEMDPFQVTGVDFTGALYVQAPGGECKAYICLFTCAVSRAVHLEIVTDLTVDNFLQAFRRFVARRSLPQLLISDNGSTFLAAAEDTFCLYRIIRNPCPQRYPMEVHTKTCTLVWRFLGALGGTNQECTEKDVRTGTHHGLQTIVVEIEARLNNRPLTNTSSDVDDPEPISPSHLLHGKRIVTLPHSITQDDENHDPDFGDDSALRRRAKRQALVIKHFWNRWKGEYLTALRETHRMTGNNDQRVKTGDVVLVHDDSKRVNWKLAVIESVNKGKDNMIRSAIIRTATGRTNRPISRLYPLEVSAAEATVKQPVALERSDSPIHPKRPIREAAEKGRIQMKEWITSIRGPPEDVTDSD